MKMDVNKMVKMGVLSALSVVLMLFVRFPIIPAAPYLEYEPADVPILIGTFLYGPAAGLIMTTVVSLIQSFTVSFSSGWVGFVMHIIATGTLVLVSGSIYKRVHTFKGAILALIAGALSMTLVMIPSNLFFSVKFFNMSYDAVVGLLIPAIIPFNLIKAFTNAVIVLLVYKPVGKFLKASGSGELRME
ncbi:MAG: ECF transporter S component [Clostridiales bacterium]|jgi:riboflavin transporter FmnP|nr:ECF transporter S component [Eubacteriales bacterium]MDH7565470.1 ECF transporter S component [Clostridiales bacterium]